MLARKLGYLAVTGSLLFSYATVAEAKHRTKHSHRSTHSVEQGSSGTSGMASVYASKRDGYAGGRSASGERVHSGALTAAHRRNRLHDHGDGNRIRTNRAPACGRVNAIVVNC